MAAVLQISSNKQVLVVGHYSNASSAEFRAITCCLQNHEAGSVVDKPGLPKKP
jgi:hypothetical protein